MVHGDSLGSATTSQYPGLESNWCLSEWRLYVVLFVSDRLAMGFNPPHDPAQGKCLWTTDGWISPGLHVLGEKSTQTRFTVYAHWFGDIMHLQENSTQHNGGASRLLSVTCFLLMRVIECIPQFTCLFISKAARGRAPRESGEELA